ncbi:MAG: hypothetical protein BVN34_08280 [Proteobacteria bacterium ST_bin12]|nr:MAG: hypothetical protein BVN34_08280 [Proteobacteria bacterium ST_bin12]
MDAALAFGRVLRKLRLEKGLTQEELGLDAELRRTYISVLELGNQQPSLTTILKVAKALNKPSYYIIELVVIEMQNEKL